MTNWKETTLGEIVEIIDGDRGLNYPKNDEFFDDEFCLFLNTKNVPNTEFSFSERMFINEEKDLRLRKGKLKRGDFVLTTRGTIGNFAYFSKSIPFDNIRINSGMVILRAKESLDKDFLNFYLKSHFFKEQTVSLSSGTAQPQLPIKDLKYFQILLPPIEEQKEISRVLSSLDDKIELLREENKTLEATAQTIFKEWFVNFNFPSADGKPYKSSGGKMMDSELGEIPEGWRVGRLSNIAQVDWGIQILLRHLTFLVGSS
jgi:type I restriction enzyme S subunit